MLDINSFIIVCRMLGFHCSPFDWEDTIIWLQNNNMIAHGPDSMQTHILLIDRLKFIEGIEKVIIEEDF